MPAPLQPLPISLELAREIVGCRVTVPMTTVAVPEAAFEAVIAQRIDAKLRVLRDGLIAALSGHDSWFEGDEKQRIKAAMTALGEEFDG